MARTDGVKIYEPCSKDCIFAAEGLAEYIVPWREHPTVYLDVAGGRRSTGHTWHVFVCNDPNCCGKVIVRWDALMKFIAEKLGKGTRFPEYP